MLSKVLWSSKTHIIHTFSWLAASPLNGVAVVYVILVVRNYIILVLVFETVRQNPKHMVTIIIIILVSY